MKCISFSFLSVKCTKGFPSGLVGKESACNAGDTGDVGLIPRSGRFPGGRGMVILSSILAGKVPWTEEPGGLCFLGS